MTGRDTEEQTAQRAVKPRLVFGASGYIGSNLVPYLMQHEVPVRAAARRLDVLEARRWSGVDLRQADALQAESLADVLRGVDVAYYLVHSMRNRRESGVSSILAAWFPRVQIPNISVHVVTPARYCGVAACLSPRCAPVSSSAPDQPRSR